MGGTIQISRCKIFNNKSSHGAGISNSNFTSPTVGTVIIADTIISFNNAHSDTSNSFGGGIYNEGKMLISNSIIENNSSTTVSGFSSAGGIYNVANSQLTDAGALTIENSTVTNNVAGSYGGIYNGGGFLKILNSEISFNKATANAPRGDGGGLQHLGQNKGGIEFINSILSNNIAANRGGGLYAYGGTIVFQNSQIENNYAGSNGGGINSSVDATLTVENCTLSNNASNARGGAIYQLNGPDDTGSAEIINSTISANSAVLEGGGIYNYAPLSATHVTFFGNSSPSGNSIYVANNPIASTQIFNSIISDNDQTTANCSGAPTRITDGGYNISDDSTCNLVSLTSLDNTNPMLGNLSNNGGFTHTHAIQPGSPAIDSIPPGINGCGDTVTTDQRGVLRPQGEGCDSGSYEFVQIPNVEPCKCDINRDGRCNILDYQVFIQDWGRTNCGTPSGSGNPPNDCECDLNTDGKCNILDYQIFIIDWGRTDCPIVP